MPADAYSRMDSSGSASDSGSGSENLSTSPGTSTTMDARQRIDSEGADRQPRFILPGAAGSPPKILTMNEVNDVLINVENMTLAHEIAVNPEFRLQPYEPSENSLEKNVKEMIHKAFWSSIREQLARDPPCYDDAIQLLADIKEGFSHIISKNNQKALDKICEVLDSSVIRQQAEQGVLDFKSYANFIIQIMARSCAPVRDEEVAKLNDITDVVDMFRGILETMTLMKLDMANCLLEAARKDVIAHSVEYEKQKFKEFITVYTQGFPATENWLNRHRPDDTNVRNWMDSTIISAFMELLDFNADHAFPETIAMDKDRILDLAAKSLRTCVCASALFIAGSLPIIGQNTENKHTVKQQITILLQSVKTEKDLEECMENVWLQIKSIINSRLLDSKSTEMDADTEASLKRQIMLLAQRNSPIRSLMWIRLMTYVRLINTSKVMPQPPPGYSDFLEELDMCIAFRRITFYNYSVFGEFYHQILSKERPTVETVGHTSTTSSTTTTTTQTTTKTTTSSTTTSTD